MNHLFERYTNLILTISLAIIAFSTVFLVLFYIILPNYRPVLDSSSIVMPPLASGVEVHGSELLESGTNLGGLIGISLLVILALLALTGFSLFGHMKHQKIERDERRRRDLEQLRQGFETYKSIHGHYPMSSTYQPEYYTGINLSKDWNYYGLPNADQMKTIIKDWPLSDPSIDYHGSNQVNQYLYYPRNTGRSFDLYAHLELPKPGEQTDYNVLDNLLRAWGSYNYKISSLSSDSNSTSQPHSIALPSQQNMASESAAMQQMIVEQTIPSDSHEINAEINFLADEVVADVKPPLPDTMSAPSPAVPSTNKDQFGVLSQAVSTKQAIHENMDLPVTDILPEGSQQ